MRASAQRGEGKLGLIVSLALLGLGIFLAVKIIPVRIAAYEFQDFVEEECRYAAVRKGDDTVRKRILQKAEELDLPLEPKNLRLERRSGEMIIRASFVKPIDLKFTVYHYAFEVEERAPLF